MTTCQLEGMKLNHSALFVTVIRKALAIRCHFLVPANTIRVDQ